MFGILLIDKPLGGTSHDVVNQVRRKFGTRRVGHAGTLDPLGTGLLVVAVGPATRFLMYLDLEPKVYELEATFGQSSDTQDAEGELSDPRPVPGDLAAQLAEAIPGFQGLIEQIPPMYSAVKIKGQPLYKYARKGEEVEREPRTVHIGAIEVLSAEDCKVRMRVECSGGTYVRTLVHDIGAEIGCGAFLSSLRRTRCGSFTLAEAASIEAVGSDDLIPLAEALKSMAMLDLNDRQAAAIRQGQKIGVVPIPDADVLALRYRGEVIGIARRIGNQLQPECVLPIEVEHGVA